MRKIEGKLALVTGAAAGIGRSLALALARERTDLLLVDIDAAGLAGTVATAASAGAEVQSCVADLSRSEEVSRVAARARDQGGGVDILVNNAGVAYYGTTHEMADDQLQQVLSVNLLAPIQLTRELLPSLFARPESHVLNVCSVAGLVGVSRLALYNTTKFALVGFSESLRLSMVPAAWVSRRSVLAWCAPASSSGR